MDSLHTNSERGRVIGDLVTPSRGLGDTQKKYLSILNLHGVVVSVPRY
jgi:hypothetical protein